MDRYEDLDNTDIAILRILQENSRLTAKELAAKIHLSPSPAFERQKRLEREGDIKGCGEGRQWNTGAMQHPAKTAHGGTYTAVHGCRAGHRGNHRVLQHQR